MMILHLAERRVLEVVRELVARVGVKHVRVAQALEDLVHLVLRSHVRSR